MKIFNNINNRLGDNLKLEFRKGSKLSIVEYYRDVDVKSKIRTLAQLDKLDAKKSVDWR